jgi:hypothetical protein
VAVRKTTATARALTLPRTPPEAPLQRAAVAPALSPPLPLGGALPSLGIRSVDDGGAM